MVHGYPILTARIDISPRCAAAAVGELCLHLVQQTTQTWPAPPQPPQPLVDLVYVATLSARLLGYRVGSRRVARVAGPAQKTCDPAGVATSCVGLAPPPPPAAGPQQLAVALVICAATSKDIASSCTGGAGPPPPPDCQIPTAQANTQHTSIGATIELKQQANRTCGRFQTCVEPVNL